jgi:hypothetical protein
MSLYAGIGRAAKRKTGKRSARGCRRSFRVAASISPDRLSRFVPRILATCRWPTLPRSR